MAACDSKKNIAVSERTIYNRTLDRLKSYDLADLGILLLVFYIFAHRWFVHFLRSGLLQLIFIIILLLFIFLSSDTKKLRMVEFSKIDIFWFFGFIIILIYIILAGFMNYSKDIFVYGTGLAFIFIAKVDIDKYKLAFSFIVGAALIYALGTVAQYLFTDNFNQVIFNFTTPITQQRIVYVTQRGYFPGLGLGKTGLAAGYIAAGLGLVSFNWELKIKKHKIIDAVVMIILLAGLVLTGKRSAILWVAVALPFVYIILGTGKVKLLRLIKMATLVLIIVLLVLTLFQVFDSVAPLSRIEKIYRALEAGDGISGDRDIRARFFLFRTAWKIFLDNPIFGVGWDQFRLLTSGSLSGNNMVHNIYLQLLSEMGIIGFTAVMVAMLYSYVLTYKSVNILMMSPDSHKSLWAKGLSFSLYYQTFFMLMGLSESIFYALHLTLIYFFSIAITNAYLISVGKAYFKINLSNILGKNRS